MKNYLLLLILLLSTIIHSQKPEFTVSILQNGKEIKIKNNATTLEQSSFALVYKFQGENVWSLIAGSNDKITETYQSETSNQERFISKAESGGADGYFNEGKSIRAWDGEIETTILFEDNENHRFDSIYTKGKWTYGVRTIEELSTRDGSLLVEDWPSNYLIIGTGITNYATVEKHTRCVSFIKINFVKAENEFPYTVKGKEYVEEGEAEYQEGCEGCGNLGSFHFQSNGKDVDYLMSGSDTGSFGTYTQKGDRVFIQGEDFSFTVSPDGKSMTHNKYQTVYKLIER
jgi:hypothetical protein